MYTFFLTRTYSHLMILHLSLTVSNYLGQQDSQTRLDNNSLNLHMTTVVSLLYTCTVCALPQTTLRASGKQSLLDYCTSLIAVT